MKNKTNRYYDRSPEISPEKRLEHDRKAMRYNYEAALNEIASLINRSKLQKEYVRANKEHVWTDQQGRTWVCDHPIAKAERTLLDSELEVIRDYERQEASRALVEIKEVRGKSEEKGKTRLSEFKTHEGSIKPDITADKQMQSRNAQEEIER